MRVLMFGWEFPPFNSGGLGVACKGLCKSLAHEAVDVVFVLPKRVNLHSSEMEFVFADIPNLSMRGVDSLLSPYITSNDYIKKRLLNCSNIYGQSLLEEVYRYSEEAGKIAREVDFDIIHAHDWLSFLAGLEAKKQTGKPLVVHVHATEFDRSGGESVNSAVYEIEKMGMEGADRVITVSNYTKDIASHKYGVDEDKISVVHNGTDYEGGKVTGSSLKSLKKEGRKIVLFVGRITLQKGPDHFLHAAKIVLEHNPDALFVFVGSGDMEGSIIEEVARLGISQNVMFAGFLRGDELTAAYRAADLFVMPSVSEPFGITPLESLINGTPVLVSRQSGVSEVLTHALKTDFWDAEDMASKILAVLDHKSLRDLLGENGRKQAKKITWDEAAEKCIDIYRQVLTN